MRGMQQPAWVTLERRPRRKHRMSLVLTFVVLLGLVSSGVAFAGGGNSDRAPGKNKAALIWYYTNVEPTGSPTPGGVVDTLGGAISGGYYGNTSNSGVDPDAPDNGHGVTASLAPGPAKGGCAGVVPGASIGHVITGNGPAAVGKTDDQPC